MFAALSDPEARSLLLTGAIGFWIRFWTAIAFIAAVVALVLRLAGFSPTGEAIRAFDRFVDRLDEDDG